MLAQLAALARSNDLTAAQEENSSYETDIDIDTDDEFVQLARAHARISKARFRPLG